MKHGRLGACAAVLFIGTAGVLSPGCFSRTPLYDGCISDDGCKKGDPCSNSTCDTTTGECNDGAPNVGMSCGGSGMTCNGAGQCAGCSADADCGPTTTCGYRCDHGQCRVQYPVDVKGSCTKPQCDGNGQFQAVADPTNVPPDSGPCFEGACSGSTPVQNARAVGTSCSAGGSFCDGNGACVGCLGMVAMCGSAPCPLCDGTPCDPATNECTSCIHGGVYTCVAQTCKCGGLAAGNGCTMNAQCESGQCVSGQCQ